MFISVNTMAQNNHQEVVSSGGGFYENENFSFSSTIGEVFVETYSNDNYILTQGFQQTKLTIVGIEEISNLNYSITAFPNPVNDYITITINGENSSNNNQETMHYMVYDINGKVVDNQQFSGKSAEISFTTLLPSTYFIKIFENKKEIKTFKVIKQ